MSWQDFGGILVRNRHKFPFWYQTNLRKFILFPLKSSVNLWFYSDSGEKNLINSTKFVAISNTIKKITNWNWKHADDIHLDIQIRVFLQKIKTHCITVLSVSPQKVDTNYLNCSVKSFVSKEMLSHYNLTRLMSTVSL